MSDFLQTMAKASAERAARIGPFRSAEFDRPVVKLDRAGFGIIAEIKQRSPAEGELAGNTEDRDARARAYAGAGAAAISVLTEPTRFDGHLTHLQKVIAAVPGTAVMRKDFLVEAVQVLEARAAGASGVLLIVAMLDDARLRAMLDCAYEHGMFVLLECFDAVDLERTSKILGAGDHDQVVAGQLLFGINTRNLRTLAVDPDRLGELAPMLPEGRCVAESGLKTAADVRRVAALGYSMALVGTALMRAADPAALVAAMRDAGATGLAA